MGDKCKVPILTGLNLPAEKKREYTSRPMETPYRYCPALLFLMTSPHFLFSYTRRLTLAVVYTLQYIIFVDVTEICLAAYHVTFSVAQFAKYGF
jgi:hypothetical protein